MTVKDAYYLALAQLGESRASEGDYEEDVIIGKVNALIWELWPCSTALRAAEGKEPGEIRAVAAMEDELPLEEKVVRMPLVYGLASGMAFDDDDLNRAGFFNDLKNEYLAKSLPAVIGEIVDVY